MLWKRDWEWTLDSLGVKGPLQEEAMEPQLLFGAEESDAIQFIFTSRCETTLLPDRKNPWAGPGSCRWSLLLMDAWVMEEQRGRGGGGRGLHENRKREKENTAAG